MLHLDGRSLEVQRKRSLKFWSDHQTYQNVDEFISRVPVSGVHCVRRGNQFLDLLYLNRHAKTTLIVFHASLSKRASTVPRLEGARLAEDTGCNLIAVADPTVGLGDIDLAWFLGNRGVGKLTDCFTPLIQHCLNHAESERTILYGPSGGGFAAANFGQFFPGSIVLGVNPRLDLFSPPDADISRYLTVAHRVEGLTPQSESRRSLSLLLSPKCILMDFHSTSVSSKILEISTLLTSSYCPSSEKSLRTRGCIPA